MASGRSIAALPSAPAVQLGLLVALLLAIGVGTPPPTQVAATFLLAGALLVSLRVRIGPAAILLLFVLGVVLRVAFIGVGRSDVLSVTRLAIDAMLAGGSPYGVGFPPDSPAAAPFAYGPLALLWYLPAADPHRLELLVSLVLLAVLAVRGRPLGLAVYAVSPALLITASDGSNDHSAGLFLLVALLVAERLPTAGGAVLAVAAAFKPYALAWLPPLLAFGGWVGPLLAFLGSSAALWAAPLVAWGPQAILESFRLAESVHRTAYYSLAYALGWQDDRARAVVEGLRYAFGAAVAGLTLLSVRGRDGLVLGGIAVYLATLFTGFWSTFAYVAAIAPIVCWHLDRWAGLAEGRVRWPGDPVGALAARVDARWPVRGPRGAATIIRA